MALSFAAVFYRPDQVDEPSLRRGFAVATAGFELPDPSLTVAELPGASGWWVGFYSSGLPRGPGRELEELELSAEIFEQELPPGLAVREQAGGESTVVHSLVYAEDPMLDDAASFSAEGLCRRYVREGDEGPEAGRQDDDASEQRALELPDDDAATEALLAPHRGSTYLSERLGVRARSAALGALYQAERRIPIRLVDADPVSIAAQTSALLRSLGRVEGRGSFEPPPQLGAASAPQSYLAFVRTYHFTDPSDPADLYRGLALGAVKGTLHFHRAKDLERLASSGEWCAGPAARGLYPLASLRSDALGGASREARMLAIAPDGDALRVVDERGRDVEAGPRFGELLLYLSLGFRARSDAEDDLIEATMLRAEVRRT